LIKIYLDKKNSLKFRFKVAFQVTLNFKQFKQQTKKEMILEMKVHHQGINKGS
jgi:hypothetical protein